MSVSLSKLFDDIPVSFRTLIQTIRSLFMAFLYNEGSVSPVKVLRKFILNIRRGRKDIQAVVIGSYGP